MQVWRFLVHVNHRRHDIFFAHSFNEEVRRSLEKRLNFLWGLLLKKLRAGGNQRIYKPGAVPAGAAASLFNAVLYKVVVPARPLNNVEIVLTSAGVNVGIAGVLFLLPFVMGFQRSCRIALVFFKSQNCVLCHETPFPIPFLSGIFHRKIPQKISQIGREWIEYKSIFLSLYFYIPSDFRTSRGLIIVLHEWPAFADAG